MGSEDSINGAFYDCSKLFPPKFDLKVVDPETKRWLSKSSITVAAVGLSSKFWLKCKDTF
jgi:hypothetical protein